MRAVPWVVAVLAAVFVPAVVAQEAPGASPAPAAPSPLPEPSPSPTPPPAPRPPFVAGYKNGFTLQSETGDFVLRLTALVQVDGRFALSDDRNLVTNQFLLRRVRPALQGTVAKYFDFFVNPDFGLGTTVLQDAYLDVHFTNKLRVRAGKMKSPFGLERLQSAQSILFVERGLPTLIAPNRDVGVQVHGELGQGVFGYQLALLDGVTDAGNIDGDTNDAKDFVGRVFFQPWRAKGSSPLRGLGFGAAGSTGTANGPLRGYSALSQVSVFSYATTVNAAGKRQRWSPQAWLFAGPVGVLAEYVEAHHEVERVEVGKPTVSGTLENSAWDVTGSWLVTGEDATYGNVKPKNFFVPSARKWGAVQLVARVQRLSVDATTFSGGYADPTRSIRRATAWGVGVNWIWNQNLKYVLDYEQTRFQGGAAGGADRPTEKSVQTRLQLAF
jgi:phosphate-selective porin OprO/OprP